MGKGANGARASYALGVMRLDPPGYFCRAPWLRGTKFAFTNYGVSFASARSSQRCSPS
jgi:hypothetical protein